MRDNKILIGVALVAVIIGVGIFLYSGSSWRGTSPEDASASVAGAVSFTPLARGVESSVHERVNYLITSSDQLSQLWKTIGAGGMPPAVDFSTHEVIAVFAGSDPVADITVAKIQDTTTRMVSVSIAKPDGTCAGKDSGSPYQIVAMPTTSLPLAHQDLVSTTSCAN